MLKCVSASLFCYLDDWMTLQTTSFIHVYFMSTGEAIRKKRCKAAFSYAPQNEDELELKIGDVIEVLGEVRTVRGCSFKQMRDHHSHIMNIFHVRLFLPNMESLTAFVCVFSIRWRRDGGRALSTAKLGCSPLTSPRRCLRRLRI